MTERPRRIEISVLRRYPDLTVEIDGNDLTTVFIYRDKEDENCYRTGPLSESVREGLGCLLKDKGIQAIELVSDEAKNIDDDIIISGEKNVDLLVALSQEKAQVPSGSMRIGSGNDRGRLTRI